MARFLEKQREALASAMQDEVFGVASQILREKGFAGLTMDRIARQAGVSRGTLYNYFADAEAVLTFVEARVVEPLIEAVETIAGTDMTAADKLAAFLTVMFDSINDDRALAFALFSTRKLTGPRAANKRQLHNQLLSVVQRIAAAGVAAGELREIDASVLANIFLGTLIGLIEAMFASGEVQPAKEIVPPVMDVLLNGIRSAPASHR